MIKPNDIKDKALKEIENLTEITTMMIQCQDKDV